jgi:hypothetical protein
MRRIDLGQLRRAWVEDRRRLDILIDPAGTHGRARKRFPARNRRTE